MEVRGVASVWLCDFGRLGLRFFLGNCYYDSDDPHPLPSHPHTTHTHAVPNLFSLVHAWFMSFWNILSHFGLSTDPHTRSSPLILSLSLSLILAHSRLS